jgi:predicted DNA binding CopG/RHH family protein
MTTNG